MQFKKIACSAIGANFSDTEIVEEKLLLENKKKAPTQEANSYYHADL